MSQIPKNNIQKFVKGGSPTTYQEYQRRKSEIDSKNLENRAKHDADKIKINGVDRSRKELVYALRSWASTGSSDLLRRGYGKNTQNLSSDYESFLNALSNGDIESIDSNADGGSGLHLLQFPRAGSGIRCNAIAPGFLVSNQNRALLFNEDGSPSARSRKILNGTPMGRFVENEELLGATFFLCDDRSASAITGVVLPVDAGFAAYSGV